MKLSEAIKAFFITVWGEEERGKKSCLLDAF